MSSRAWLAVSFSFAVACNGSELPPGSYEGDAPLVQVWPDACATPDQGCPCSIEGQSIECGALKSENSGYATCSVGLRTCNSGLWSACAAQGTRVQAIGKQRLQGLGTSQDCNNPCDPFCSRITDDSTGLTVEPGDDVEVTSSGVTLTQTETSVIGTPCTSLAVTTTTPTLTVTQFSPVSPSSVQFSAALSPSGCYPGTPPVVWAIDRFDIATIDGAGLLTLVSPNAGTIRVTGYSGSLSATFNLNVVLNVLDATASPSASATSAFANTVGSADTAKVLYPYADTVLPLGLLSPLVQWNTGTTGSATAVKLSVRYPATGTATFQWSQIIAESRTLGLNPPTNTINLASGPRASIPQSVWTAFEQTAKGQDALIVLQRLTGSTLRPEIKTKIHFATNQLKGTVYYQSYGTNLVQNFSSTLSGQTVGGGQRFGAATLAIRPGATYPTVAAGYTSSTDGPGCRVCHSAAAGGSVIVSNLHSSADSTLYRLGTDSASGGVGFPTVGDGRYGWPGIYPDGSFIFSNSGPSPVYAVPGATPPGGLEDSAWCKTGSPSPCTSALTGTPPPNALYSLSTSNIGTLITSAGIPTNLRATMPVFSPDGTRLAFNHYAGTVGSVTGDKRSLGMMDFNNGTKTFSNFRRLVTQPTSACSSAFGTTDPCTNVWPTFLPGNEGVVFEREIFNNGRVSGANHSDFGGTRSGCDGTGTCGDDGTKAELWWVSTDSTPTEARLNKANGRNADGSLYIPTAADVSTAATAHSTTNEPILNYEPTMSPSAVGGYYWVAFTSRRLYGNVATVNPWWSDPRFKPIGGGNGPTTKKIWVSAISTSATEGSDPSSPPFYLPGQEYLAGNSKAYWVLDACKAASNTRSTANLCESDLDCCGAPSTAVCSLQTPISNPPKRHCIPVSTSSCIADDAATQCTSDAQCCGFSTGSRCANGVCRLPPPLLLYTPGNYVRDFHAECPSGTHAVWQVFEWQASVPTGTSIDFVGSTASTAAGLSTAATIIAGTASPPSVSGWANNPVNLQSAFQTAGQTSREYLRIVMQLNPSSDRLSAPTITNWRVAYDCFDNE
ncbi:MAG TPA: hypothetical protein VFQ61_30840 [Polyangiaceae bacterium]|nr:hypothetical protein [Polyangiaceae bacterium]